MPSGYKHLTLEGRSQIYALLSTGFMQSEIASHLNVSRSTISKEIKRNKSGNGIASASEQNG